MSNIFTIGELFSVSGNIVVVTGGGSGIGKALATGFSANGAKVYIVGRREKVLRDAASEIFAQTKNEVFCINGDVSSKDGCANIVAQLGRHERSLDTLINCAGVQVPWKETPDPRACDDVERQMLSVDDDDFNFTNRININGLYFLTTFAIPLLRKSPHPSVLNIASVLGIGASRVSGTLTYSVSKAAAIHLGKLMAGKLAPFGIRVNVLAPGIFPSEMSNSSGAISSSSDKTSSRTPVGRSGLPQEIVGPALMLSSKAGAFCDGVILAVDGGRLLNLGNDDGVGIPHERLQFP